MARFIRRLLVFALLGAAAAAAVRALRGRPALTAPPDTGPTWPPLDTGATTRPAGTEPSAAVTTAAVTTAAVAATPRWVAPVDGACPTGYPVKANDSSHIYHVPGGQFYERTVPERCYTDPQAAEADGYRAARR
jgi:hypothetical protein